MTSRFETEHSPAVRAVLNAYRDGSWTPDEEDDSKYYKFSHKAGMAAALRAAADQLGHEVLGVRCVDCFQIALIAAELEGAR